jgi:hypothetical protein
MNLLRASKPNTMGKPLNRATAVEDAIPSDWRPSSDGADMPDIPAFLRQIFARWVT